MRRIILAIWYARGWKIDTPLPKHLKKFVIAGAPHTTNWDFVFFTGATHEEGVRPNFMGKHTLFNGIMKNFMLDIGRHPDRPHQEGQRDPAGRRRIRRAR